MGEQPKIYVCVCVLRIRKDQFYNFLFKYHWFPDVSSQKKSFPVDFWVSHILSLDQKKL